MIVCACVKFYTKEYSSTPSRMYNIPCHRHADAFYVISQFLESDEIDKPRTEQGFLTQDNTFLDRYAAMDEVIKCHQLPPEAKEKCAELYSEDLW